jgi:phosphoribosylformylglycinamidine cyclo-ligase
MGSSGLHSNGYSLARHVFFGGSNGTGVQWSLDRDVPELGTTLGEALLTPTRLYTLPCLDLVRRTQTHAMSHVTGGGLAANLERVLPESVSVRVDRSTWTRPAIFDLVADLGGVSQRDLEEALNIGVGMVALVAPDDADAALRLLADHGVQAWIAGEVADAGVHGSGGSVTMAGTHA